MDTDMYSHRPHTDNGQNGQVYDVTGDAAIAATAAAASCHAQELDSFRCFCACSVWCVGAAESV